MPVRRRLVGLTFAIAAAVLAVDQLAKAWVVRRYADGHETVLVGGAVHIVLARNAGAAFSIGTGATWLFSLVAVGVAVAVVRVAPRLGSAGWATVLGLVLGGALGNLADRLLRAPGVLRGHVVDFVRVPHFAVFNLADSAITVGVLLAIWLSVRAVPLQGRAPADG